MTDPNPLPPGPPPDSDELDDRPRPATDEEIQQLRSRNIRRGVRVFILLGVLAAGTVMALTVNRDTLTGLAELKPHWLALTILLWLFATGVDGLRLVILSWAGEHRLSLRRAVEVILAGFFMAAITPFQVGGLPLQLYAMNRWGISPGKATAMLLVRTILFYGMLFAASPFIAVRLGVSSLLFKVLSGYIAVVAGTGLILITLTLFFPALVTRWRWQLSRRTRPGRFRRLLIRFLGEFRQFARGVKLYFVGRNLLYLLAATILTVVYILSYFGMTAAILGGLGVISVADVPRVLGINNLLMAVLLYIPTPGSSGVAEAAAAGLYSMLCPKHMLGIFVVLWRLFSFYISAFLGGAVALRHIAGGPARRT